MNLQTLTMAALLLDEAADLLEALGPDKLADHPKFRFPLADELGGAASMLRSMHQRCAERVQVPDTQSIVSDQELIRAFAGTNFGTSEHRRLLHQGVLKKACGYHCGHTITMIMRDLGLICKKEPLLPTRKGRDLLRIAFHEQMVKGP